MGCCSPARRPPQDLKPSTDGHREGREVGIGRGGRCPRPSEIYQMFVFPLTRVRNPPFKIFKTPQAIIMLPVFQACR
ncbi:hypothetical protein AB1N83_014268 [Pleurotus pulmonarius]